MLEGDVEVVTDLRGIGHDVDQAGRDEAGVGVHQAQPVGARFGGEPLEQSGEAVGVAPLGAVGGAVLSDEHDFAGAALDELLGFGDESVRGL